MKAFVYPLAMQLTSTILEPHSYDVVFEVCRHGDEPTSLLARVRVPAEEAVKHVKLLSGKCCSVSNLGASTGAFWREKKQGTLLAQLN